MRSAGIASAVLLAWVGCTEAELDQLEETAADGGVNGTDPQDSGAPPGPVSVAELCAHFAEFEGEEVHVETTPESHTRGTKVFCDCCNAVTTIYFYACASGDIELVGDATWPEVQGVVVEETNAQLAHLITTSSTRFGCVGQECHEVCTPAAAPAITAIRGIARVDQGGRRIDVSDATIE